MDLGTGFQKFETLHKPARRPEALKAPLPRRSKFRADPETTLTVLILVVSTLLVVIAAGFIKELL